MFGRKMSNALISRTENDIGGGCVEVVEKWDLTHPDSPFVCADMEALRSLGTHTRRSIYLKVGLQERQYGTTHPKP